MITKIYLQNRSSGNSLGKFVRYKSINIGTFHNLARKLDQ